MIVETNGKPHEGQITINQLRQLYNTHVVKAEKVERPIASFWGWNIPFFNHEGVKVTIPNGQQYLIHKGPGYGKSSDTVVVPAREMSSNWKTTGSKEVLRSTVADYVKDGGSNYNAAWDNCIKAAREMWKND